VGSSNFTFPGLSENVELNVKIGGPEVKLLQEWYERYWNEAEDITPEILRTMERHTMQRTPFEVYFKSLYEFLEGRELEPDAWDERDSEVFKILDKYQQDAYRNLWKIADRHGLAFLCDGVGLGKTYVGLMLIERLIFKEHKQVVLFAPKAAKEDVWAHSIDRYLPRTTSKFINLVSYSHTDLQRSGKWPRELELTLKDADVVIIDEAHHFRNPGIKGERTKAPSRYRLLQNYLKDGGRPKRLFLLTATPVNNSIHDFRHVIELYTGESDRYFATSLGIHSLRAHFMQLEKSILKRLPQAESAEILTQQDIKEVETLLKTDKIFDALVVQRSRNYVKDSQKLHGGAGTIFPERERPKVAVYQLKSVYGDLLEGVRKAFHKEKPLFVLGVYYPLAYWKGDKESPEYKFDEGRQKQVVMLIRTLFLKRFESSAKAFEGSCWRLLQKLLAWVTVHCEKDHDKRVLDRWKTKNAELIGYVREHQKELWPSEADEDEVEDYLDEDILSNVQKLDPELYAVDNILDDSFDDLDQLAEFLREVAKVKPERDSKLKALINLLKKDVVLSTEKVIIFTEFADTARYLEQELIKAGIKGIHRIDGGSSQKSRSDILKRFAPYYNDSSSAKLTEQGKEEIRVLISTDVLSEGLNLQDATRLINYDLHWNPVRLMQRIGRVDRRLNPDVEARIIADHPELKDRRGKVAFWNFLPPEELDDLLRLFQRVTKKVMIISRTLGIEGRTLLRPDDDYDPIRELNEQCDGIKSEAEKLRLEYDALVQHYPDIAGRLEKLPLKLFSGKTQAGAQAKGVFFCYRIPRPDPALIETEANGPRWSAASGYTVWLYHDLEGDRELTEPGAIAAAIRCNPGTPRQCSAEKAKLADLRKKVEKQIVNTHLRSLNAPIGVNPVLKCWMELS